MADEAAATIRGTLHSGAGMGVVHMSARYEPDCGEIWSALTDPERSAHWYGKVEGDFRVGGKFTAHVLASEWDGQGRIEACVPHQRLEVTVWEKVGEEHVVAVELTADGDLTSVALEVRGVPLDLVWAYGVGWQVHLEDLGAHLSGLGRRNLPTRWNELEPPYRGMTVAPL